MSPVERVAVAVGLSTIGSAVSYMVVPGSRMLAAVLTGAVQLVVWVHIFARTKGGAR